MNNQQKYIKQLQSITGSPLQFSILWWNEELKRFVPGPRKSIDSNPLFDERTVAINEVIFELDAPSYRANYEYSLDVIDILEMDNIPYFICASGGKGIHIHTFFNPIKFQHDKHKEIFKEALSYGMTWKHIRIWWWRNILQRAGIENKIIGKGKYFDSAPMIFNYYAGTTHLIKMIGGRRINKIGKNRTETFYKTYIPKELFKNIKPNVKVFEDVKFPDKIECFDINESELVQFLNTFISQQKRFKVKRSLDKFEGKYLKLESVKKLREGLGTGQRSAGAAILSIACKLDDLQFESARDIMKDYANNCEQSGHSFQKAEAYNWLKWTYANENVYWNCGDLEELGLHNRPNCDICNLQYEKEQKFLENPNLVEEIKKLLDETIVGETQVKFLMFMLALTKDFPSKSSKPDWVIPSDPESQTIILSSDSASGKSYVSKNIMSLLGEENVDYFVVSRITKSALNYYVDIDMDGKIIFIEELQGLDENTEQLRVWMSEGQLSLATVEKKRDEDGNEVNQLEFKQTKGKPVFISNQAEGKIGEQLNNRAWILSLDLSDKQTKQIMEFITKQSRGDYIDISDKVRTLRDALKLLKPYHYIIPWLNEEFLELPHHNIRMRRDYKKILTAIQVSAYLHQYQRTIVVDKETGLEYILCTLDDYELAREMTMIALSSSFSGMTASQQSLLEFIKNATWKDEFVVSDLIRNLGKSHTHWHNELSQLIDLGFIDVQRGRGISSKYSLIEKKITPVALPKRHILEQKIQTHLQQINQKKSKNRDFGHLDRIFRKVFTRTSVQLKKVEIVRIQNLGNFLVYGTGVEKIDHSTSTNSHLKKKQQRTYGKTLNGLNDDPKNGMSVCNTEKFAGVFTRIELIEYLNHIRKDLIEIETIVEHFGEENRTEIDKIISQSLEDGTIYEPKPGRIQLVK